MLAIEVTSPGGPDQLRLTERPDPVAGPGQVLVAVAAAGVNRADLMQREGRYPPPPGASPILGLECAGTIVALGDGVTDWPVGTPVCALLAGGGYAQRVVVPAGQLLPIPDGVGLTKAAGLPETTCTVWSNLVMAAGLTEGETVLIHGGGSGIGTTAIQIAKALGATVAVTASRRATLDACAELGADVLIDYTSEDFAAVLAPRGGADVILDVVGGPYLDRNVAALHTDGRLVIIGMQGGTRAEINLGGLVAKRGRVIATTLRARPANGPHGKAEVVAATRAHVWPLVASGTVRPVIDSVFPLADAAGAHRRMAEGGHLGKILLQVEES